MSPIAAGFIAFVAALRPRSLAIALAGLLCAAATRGPAQSTPPPSAPPAPATYTGCVQKAPGADTTLVISTPNACAKLAGKLSPDDLAGHQVVLSGILTLRTPSAPASIQVDSVVSVGKTCTDVCSLRPPGTRGLHRPDDNATPGTEGGTAGAAPSPH